jgi:signal transduction histidine kinase
MTEYRILLLRFAGDLWGGSRVWPSGKIDGWLLGRSPSTVSREISQNGGYDGYRAALADDKAWAPVRGDCVQLQQVVMNLILNAVEAMGAVEAGPRELLISTEHTDAKGVLVAVRDPGPGIDHRTDARRRLYPLSRQSGSRGTH